ADAKRVVRRAQRTAQRTCSGSQQKIALRMSVGVVHFLELMQVDQHKCEMLRVARGAIELFFEMLLEKASVVEARERIRGRADLELLQFVVFNENGHAQIAGRRENVDHGALKRDRSIQTVGKLAAAFQNLFPQR